MINYIHIYKKISKTNPLPQYQSTDVGWYQNYIDDHTSIQFIIVIQ